MKKNYIYAVARIRAKEVSLLSMQDVNRLMSCDNYEDCINILHDKNWGSIDESKSHSDYQYLLNQEKIKLWDLINELIFQESDFDILRYPIDFHNLKAAIKGYVTESLFDGLFVSGGTVSHKKIVSCIKNDNFSDLPNIMQESAKLAFDKFVHTSDGQLCDIILDKALLNAIKFFGEKSKSKLIRQYSEFYVASADIKIAIRSQFLHKNIKFLKMALLKCETLDVDRLAVEALKDFDSLCNYLELTCYSDVVPFIKDSLQKFELWRDNKIMELVEKEKYNSFSIGPIFAYVLARQNELKVAKIILSGKMHHLDNESIKERIRTMYV